MAILLITATAVCLGATIVVDDDGGTPDLATALSSAMPGDTVLVMPGTYVGSFDVPAGVRLVGSGAGQTILDGNGAGWTVGLGRAAEVSRFTITGGENGIEADGGTVIRENRIVGNGPGPSGGGIRIVACGAEITRNVIAGNSSNVFAGGIYMILAQGTSCQPGDPSGVISNNLITGNTSPGGGSAIKVRDLGDVEWGQRWPVVTQNTIVGNTSGNGRGALYFTSYTYVYDLATPTGVVTNNVIAGNTGGGITQYCCEEGPLSGYPYGPTISENIFSANGSPELEAPLTGIGSDGNVLVDPGFVDAAGGDYRLQPGSPAIDAGVTLAEPALVDLDGFPRPLDGDLDGVAAPDLGAFEETGEVAALTVAAGGGSVSWDARAGATLYNLYRGDLAVLLAGGDYTQDPADPGARRWCGLAGPVAVEDQSPGAGQVYFYLSTPGNPAEGSLGLDSQLQVRPNANPCP